MTIPLYPLQFKPILKQYLWGGRRLETLLGKNLGSGEHYAESWEVVDHGEDQSVVLNGALTGSTLHELVQQYGEELVGPAGVGRGRFPLLLKFLDAQRDLSVQVHPNDEQAAKLRPPDFGKTEAWYVVHADPGSRIYAGLKAGVDRGTFERAIEEGRVAGCLHVVEPHAGDCIFIPAGTIHALGAGIVVAELQQSSDTTYRIDDWGRVGTDGKPRELHIAEALQVIDFERGPVAPQTRDETKSGARRELVRCDAFDWACWNLDEQDSGFELSEGMSFHLLTVIEGEVQVGGGGASIRIGRGDSLLVPAACSAPVERISPSATLLEGSLPRR